MNPPFSKTNEGFHGGNFFQLSFHIDHRWKSGHLSKLRSISSWLSPLSNMRDRFLGEKISLSVISLFWSSIWILISYSILDYVFMNPQFSKMNERFHDGFFFNYLSTFSIVEKSSHWSNSGQCIHRYDLSQLLWNDFTVGTCDTQSFFHFNHRSKSTHQIQLRIMYSSTPRIQRLMNDFGWYNHIFIGFSKIVMIIYISIKLLLISNFQSFEHDFRTISRRKNLICNYEINYWWLAPVIFLW